VSLAEEIGIIVVKNKEETVSKNTEKKSRGPKKE